MEDSIELETHPWEPFIPRGAKVLIMGTFPPPPKRWAMDFYYPNRTNDFWQIMGLIFRNNRYEFYNPTAKTYDLDAIKQLLTAQGIAIYDTAHSVRRLKGNASDKFLEIVEPVALTDLLEKMPECKAVCSTGEKAAGVLAALTDTAVPRIGEYAVTTSGLEIWRMPSTSRAYPLALEKKATFYAKMFARLGFATGLQK